MTDLPAPGPVSTSEPEDQETCDLTDRQLKALLALLEEANPTEAARRMGCSPRTLFRYLRQPAFAAAYRQARLDAVTHAVGRIQVSTAEAVDTVRALLRSPETPAAVRLSAARALVDSALKSAQVLDLLDRVEALEQRLIDKEQQDNARRAHLAR